MKILSVTAVFCSLLSKSRPEVKVIEVKVKGQVKGQVLRSLSVGTGHYHKKRSDINVIGQRSRSIVKIVKKRGQRSKVKVK